MEAQEVWALINRAVVIETMEIDSPQERDYGENRILWSVPWQITIILKKRSSNLACIPRVSDSGLSGMCPKICISNKLPHDASAIGVRNTFCKP